MIFERQYKQAFFGHYFGFEKVMKSRKPEFLAIEPDFYSRRSRCLGTVRIFFFLVVVVVLVVGGTLNEITMCVCTSVCVAVSCV